MRLPLASGGGLVYASPMRQPSFVLLLAVACAGPRPPTVAATTTPEPAPTPAPAPAPVPAPSPASGYSGHGGESVAPEIIAKYAAAPLPYAVTANIQKLIDLRGSGGGLVTSRGDRMVFSWAISGVNQVWRQDGPMKFPIQLTGGEDATRVVDISPDDSFVLVSRDRGGEENPGLYLLPIDGGPLVEIQHKPKVQTGAAFISDDSKHIYYLANDTEPRTYTLYRWERATGKREAIYSETGLWYVTDKLGDRLLITKLKSNVDTEIWELDLATRKISPLLGQGEADYYSAGYGARPGTLLVRTDKLSDMQRLYEHKDGKLTPISPEMPHEVDRFAIDDARTKIYYEINRDGLSELRVLDARTLKPVALPRLPEAENVSASAITRNGRFVNLTVDGSRLPPTTVTYDWKQRKTITWRVPATPEVDVSKFARATLEHFPARDGTKIPMFVRRPAGCAEPCPVIVDYHGGPEAQATGGWNRTAQMYVDAGFVVVEPNVRGSAGYGKKWLDSDNAARRLEVITDVEDCAKFIREAWAVNGKAPKIGVMGGSYGGYVTLFAMTYFAGAYDAGVSNVGISNLVTFLQNTAPYRRAVRISEYGDPEKDHEALVKLSPVTHIEKIKAPLLIIQGVNDPRVPVGEALLIHDALTSRGIDTGLILFGDEGHGAQKRGNVALTIGHTIAFFEKHLK